MHKLFAALLACSLITSAWANDPRTTSAAPGTLESAAAMALAKLGPSQRSIVRGTAKDSLMTLMAEWGDDLEELLQLNAGNKKLLATICKRACTPEEATLTVMEAVWEVLQK
jgi:hypothetical protein